MADGAVGAEAPQLGQEKIPRPNLKLLEFRNQIKCKKEWLSSLRKWHSQQALHSKKLAQSLSQIPQYAQQLILQEQLTRQKRDSSILYPSARRPPQIPGQLPATSLPT